MRSYFKRFNTSDHFPDFWHTAKGQRDNKKIRARKERQLYKGIRMNALLYNDAPDIPDDFFPEVKNNE